MGQWDHEDCSQPSPDNPEMYARWLRRQQLIFNGEISEDDDERNFYNFDAPEYEIPESQWKKIK